MIAALWTFTLAVQQQPASSQDVPPDWVLPWPVLLTVDAGLVVIGIAMLMCVFRLIRGPHIADRALSLDMLALQMIALVLLLTLRLGTLVFFDGILVLSLLGYAGTVAMAQYIGRPHMKRRTEHKNNDEGEQ